MATITIDTTTQVFTSSPQPEADILLLHTTETTGWPSYGGGGSAPHATIAPIPGVGISVREHISTDCYGKSLVNLSGGVETNRRGVLQYELRGTCDPARKGQVGWYYWPEADDVVLKALADYLRPKMTKYAIPFVAAPFQAYPASYGARGKTNTVRMDGATWLAFNGICGHQHAPENDHGDPGNFPAAKLVTLLKGSTVTNVVSNVTQSLFGKVVVTGILDKPTIKLWQKIMGTPVDGVISRPSMLVRAVQRRVGVTVDGYLGPQTWKAIQRRLGVLADGIPGPITIKALQRRLNTGKF